MAVDDALVLSVIVRGFAPSTDESWEHLSAGSAWDEFLSAAREALRGGRLLGESVAPVYRTGKHPSFSEFLSEEEIDALYCPPSAEEKRQFAARHFTGGLPGSALPVESLYVPWSDSGMFAGEQGLYNSDVARYMRELTASLQLEVPDEFSACPDHLTVELEVMTLLVETGACAQARQFCIERLGWLEEYRPKLVALGPEARFWLALVDVLIGVRACQMSIDDA